MKVALTGRNRWIPGALRPEQESFLLPADGFAELIEETLGPSFGQRVLDEESGSATLWDTFDWRVWFAGRVLFESGDRWQLLEEGEERETSKARVGSALFTADFAAEDMRSWLGPVLDVRAVMPRATLSWKSRVVELLDAQRKTVCRCEIAEWSCEGAQATVRIATIHRLRGYDPEAETVRAVLASFDLAPLDRPPLVELLVRAGQEPQEFSVRPQIGIFWDMPLRLAVNRTASELLRLARRCEPGIHQDGDTEFLHDYRVCLRKLRSVVGLLKGAFSEPATNRVKESLASLARRTNRLRDCDVYLLSRRDYEEILPPELRNGLSTMFEDLMQEREQELSKVVQFLSSDEYAHTIGELERVFLAPDFEPETPESTRPIGPLIFEAIRRRYGKVVKKARGFGDSTSDEALHELRIECKKLRYLLEFATGLVSADTQARMEDALRKLQNRLGEYNDLAVQQRTLLDGYRHDPRTDDRAEMALAVGGLAAVLYDRRRHEAGMIHSRLRAFCGKNMRRLWKQTFAEAAPQEEAA